MQSLIDDQVKRFWNRSRGTVHGTRTLPACSAQSDLLKLNRQDWPQVLEEVLTRLDKVRRDSLDCYDTSHLSLGTDRAHRVPYTNPPI